MKQPVFIDDTIELYKLTNSQEVNNRYNLSIFYEGHYLGAYEFIIENNKIHLCEQQIQ